MTIKWRQPCLLVSLSACIALLMGCSALIEFFDGDQKPAPATAADAAFEHAMAVYQKADYTRALDLFARLTTADGDTDPCQPPRLGMVCCHLMLATSQAEINAAMGMWKQYRLSTADAPCDSELVLFDPIMARFPGSTTRQPAADLPSTTPPTAKRPAPSEKQFESELAAMKKKAAQAAQLQKQLDAVKIENQTLKQKIKALEAIDQSIEKKKTEISAPSE